MLYYNDKPKVLAGLSLAYQHIYCCLEVFWRTVSFYGNNMYAKSLVGFRGQHGYATLQQESVVVPSLCYSLSYLWSMVCCSNQIVLDLWGVAVLVGVNNPSPWPIRILCSNYFCTWLSRLNSSIPNMLELNIDSFSYAPKQHFIPFSYPKFLSISLMNMGIVAFTLKLLVYI